MTETLTKRLDARVVSRLTAMPAKPFPNGYWPPMAIAALGCIIACSSSPGTATGPGAIVDAATDQTPAIDATADGGPGGGTDAGAADGSSTDSAAPACTATIPSGASVAWRDDGVNQCAYLVIITRMTGSGIDFLEIVASETTGIGLALTVSVAMPAMLGGTYDCGTDAAIAALFVYTTSAANTVQSCTITIAQAGAAGGAHAVGTFTAVIGLTGGGTKTISNGTFDVPVMTAGG